MPAVKGKGCGGKRPGGGRKKSTSSRVFFGARVSPEEYAWLLEHWGDTPTSALSYLLERAMKFWPDGPHRAGATQNRKRKD